MKINVALVLLLSFLSILVFAQTFSADCPICGQTAPFTGRTRPENGKTQCEHSHQYGYGPRATKHTFWAACQ